MAIKYATPTLVINIERRYFAYILAFPQRKHIEYRDMSEYWERRLKKVGKPLFIVGLIAESPKADGLTQEHMFYYNLPHVYLAQVAVRDRLASHIRPS